MILLECKNIQKKYGKKYILKQGQLLIKQKELIGLVGENGCGKSTLLRCLLGIESFQKGEINIVESVGYCPQENYLNNKYKLQEHIEFILSFSKQKNHNCHENVLSLIKKFKLKKYMNKLIGELSSGTYQKIKLITALLQDSKLLILDEPYDGLDWQMYLVFWENIKEMQKNGKGILIVSHYIHDFNRFDRIYKIINGTVLYET